MRGFLFQQKAQGIPTPTATLARRASGQKHAQETYARQAVVLRQQGPSENLRLEDVLDAQPVAQEVVVRLKAVALNHRDVWSRSGSGS